MFIMPSNVSSFRRAFEIMKTSKKENIKRLYGHTTPFINIHWCPWLVSNKACIPFYAGGMLIGNKSNKTILYLHEDVAQRSRYPHWVILLLIGQYYISDIRSQTPILWHVLFDDHKETNTFSFFMLHHDYLVKHQQ